MSLLLGGDSSQLREEPPCFPIIRKWGFFFVYCPFDRCNISQQGENVMTHMKTSEIEVRFSVFTRFKQTRISKAQS